jgi:glycosyltransferase involved in cell wall biosynthesis
MGKIVPPMDSAALADAIIELLKDHPDMNVNIVRELEQHYSPGTVASAYEGIFQEIVEKYG